MKQLDRILKSMARKIDHHPDLKQAYQRACRGAAGSTEADQIASLYRQVTELYRR